MKDSPTWFWFAVILVSFLMVVTMMKPFEFKVTPTGAARLVPAKNPVGNAMGPAPIKKFCTDGTSTSWCSASKPKFCTTSASLVNDCARCGCPTGRICSTGGSCAIVESFSMKTYIHDDLDSSPDSLRYTLESSRFLSLNGSFNGSGVKMLTSGNTPILGIPNGGLLYKDAQDDHLSIYEFQNAYLFGYTAFDETVMAVQSKYAKTGYQVEFANSLRLCMDFYTPLQNCPSNKLLKNSKVKIWFLGSSWYVRDYALFGSQITSLKLVREDGKILQLNNYQQIGDAANWKIMIVSGYTSAASPAIRYIMAYNDIDQTYKVPATQTLNAGEGINIIKYPAGFSFSYQGIEPQPKDTLQFNLMKDYSMVLEPSNQTNATNGTGGNIATSGSIVGDVIVVLSAKSNAFNYWSSATNAAYVVVKGVKTLCTYSQNGGACSSNPVQNEVYYLNSEGNYWQPSLQLGYIQYFYDTSTPNAAVAYLIFYSPPGGIPSGRVQIYVPEHTSDNVYWIADRNNDYHINLLYDTDLRQFVNLIGSPTIDKVGYSFGSSDDFGSRQAGYITYRGSKVNLISPSSVSIDYPLNVVHAQYSLQYLGDDINWPSNQMVAVKDAGINN